MLPFKEECEEVRLVTVNEEEQLVESISHRMWALNYSGGGELVQVDQLLENLSLSPKAPISDFSDSDWSNVKPMEKADLAISARRVLNAAAYLIWKADRWTQTRRRRQNGSVVTAKTTTTTTTAPADDLDHDLDHNLDLDQGQLQLLLLNPPKPENPTTPEEQVLRTEWNKLELTERQEWRLRAGQVLEQIKSFQPLLLATQQPDSSNLPKLKNGKITDTKLMFIARHLFKTNVLTVNRHLLDPDSELDSNKQVNVLWKNWGEAEKAKCASLALAEILAAEEQTANPMANANTGSQNDEQEILLKVPPPPPPPTLTKVKTGKKIKSGHVANKALELFKEDMLRTAAAPAQTQALDVPASTTTTTNMTNKQMNKLWAKVTDADKEKWMRMAETRLGAEIDKSPDLNNFLTPTRTSTSSESESSASAVLSLAAIATPTGTPAHSVKLMTTVTMTPTTTPKMVNANAADGDGVKLKTFKHGRVANVALELFKADHLQAKVKPSPSLDVDVPTSTTTTPMPTNMTNKQMNKFWNVSMSASDKDKWMRMAETHLRLGGGGKEEPEIATSSEILKSQSQNLQSLGATSSDSESESESESGSSTVSVVAVITAQSQKAKATEDHHVKLKQFKVTRVETKARKLFKSELRQRVVGGGEVSRRDVTVTLDPNSPMKPKNQAKALWTKLESRDKTRWLELAFADLQGEHLYKENLRRTNPQLAHHGGGMYKTNKRWKAMSGAEKAKWVSLAERYLCGDGDDGEQSQTETGTGSSEAEVSRKPEVVDGTAPAAQNLLPEWSPEIKKIMAGDIGRVPSPLIPPQQPQINVQKTVNMDHLMSTALLLFKADLLQVNRHRLDPKSQEKPNKQANNLWKLVTAEEKEKWVKLAKLKLCGERGELVVLKNGVGGKVAMTFLAGSGAATTTTKSLLTTTTKTMTMVNQKSPPIVVDMDKPQDKFATPPDNSADRPFVPILTCKPNSLGHVDDDDDEEEGSGSCAPPPPRFTPVLVKKILENGGTETESEFYEHPYKNELLAWTPDEFQMNSAVFELKDLEKPEKLELLEITDSASFDFDGVISTPEKLSEALAELKIAQEIAVDLEHHDTRTFLGLTCLIQMSTRTKDYIVDGLALWGQLEGLNQVFTHPRIMKVFHGAQSDIQWLQRDFGLYVVGMFDTCVASEFLYGKQVGLKDLLKEHVGIEMDKTNQQEDWRIRPLRPDMIHYARGDTHYLLHLHDILKHLVKEKGGLDLVYQQSRDRCLTVYHKPDLTQRFSKCVATLNTKLNGRQERVLRDLFKWRDILARSLDESYHYILSNKFLERIALRLPSSEQQLLEILTPTPNNVLPPMLEIPENRTLILARISKAKAEISLDEEDEDEDEDAVVNGNGNYDDDKDAYSGINFRKIPAIPEVSELFSKEHSVIRPNIVQGPYRDAHHYLDTQFKLLREDFIRSVKPGLEDYKKSKGSNSGNTLLRGIRILKDVEFLGFGGNESNRAGARLRKWELKLSKATLNELKSTQDTKRFLPGSLLLFSKNSDDLDAKSTYAGLICYPKSKTPQAIWEVDGCFSVMLCSQVPREPWAAGDKKFVTVEVEQYFEPYKSVMMALKNNNWLGKSAIGEYILFGRRKAKAGEETANFVPPQPKYLAGISAATVKSPGQGGAGVAGAGGLGLGKMKSWREAKEQGYDLAQYRAYQAALTQEFVIIQGPPGTGKSFLGLQVLQTLMTEENQKLWRAGCGGPIIIVCYTNHALDQFGEGILDMFTPVDKRDSPIPYHVQNPRILRLGIGCQSTRLLPYTPAFGSSASATPGSAPGGGAKPKAQVTSSSVDILLMTTTGAAIRFEMIKKLKSRILIIEEAAEVLESHIVACLTPHVEHVIMLGDHQQLRPITASRELTDNYDMDVSLFERLVRNGFPRFQLETQHRMRPEIRELITGPHMYPKLLDHPSVLGFPKHVAGMTSTLFFVTHREPETKSAGESFSTSNEHEAKFLAGLCSHLIGQGHREETIVVLATYASQVKLLQKEIWRGQLGISAKLRIETADSFQGEESNIVLLSLVRSNRRNEIGFMKTDNRICVALSRAKHGLYIIGNMELLAGNSRTWKAIDAELKHSGRIGPKLNLVCDKHGSPPARGGVAMVREVTKWQDFANRPCQLCQTKKKAAAASAAKSSMRSRSARTNYTAHSAGFGNSRRAGAGGW